jgi:hypothetical protein
MIAYRTIVSANKRVFQAIGYGQSRVWAKYAWQLMKPLSDMYCAIKHGKILNNKTR